MVLLRKHLFSPIAPVVVLLLISALFLGMTLWNLQAVQAKASEKAHCLVIDAGHGGIDGGAIGLDGSKESDINLAIALKLEKLSFFCGQNCVMTRENDQRRTDILSYSEHEDLVHRCELINAVPNGVLISIHQNYYPTSQPSGAQVLYAKGEESRRFGELTHQNLVTCLQPKNRRVAEPADAALYITSHAQCPAILVECGFLSNSGDLESLKNDRYQTQVAAVLLQSYLQFIDGNTHI